MNHSSDSPVYLTLCASRSSGSLASTTRTALNGRPFSPAGALAPAEPAPGSAVRAASRVFSERFGSAPRWLAVAPGRVNLIGEHTDYNGGYVLPLAIDRHVVIAAAPVAGDGGRLRVYSAALDTSVDIRLDGSEPPGEPAWANYLRGVVRAFGERGLIAGSIDAAIVSDLPLGGGLSSSAALEVAVIAHMHSPNKGWQCCRAF